MNGQPQQMTQLCDMIAIPLDIHDYSEDNIARLILTPHTPERHVQVLQSPKALGQK